jgi:hypothetical protein
MSRVTRARRPGCAAVGQTSGTVGGRGSGRDSAARRRHRNLGTVDCGFDMVRARTARRRGRDVAAVGMNAPGGRVGVQRETAGWEFRPGGWADSAQPDSCSPGLGHELLSFISNSHHLLQL